MQEHMAFLDGLRQHGKCWKQIAVMIPSRSVVQIRTHAQKYFQKLCKAQQQAGGNASVVPEVVMDTRNGPSHGGVVPGHGAGGSSTSTSASANGGATSSSSGGAVVVPAAGWAALQAARVEGQKAPNRGSKQNSRKGHRVAPQHVQQPALHVNTSNFAASLPASAAGAAAYPGVAAPGVAPLPASSRGIGKARSRKGGPSTSSSHRRILAPAGVNSAVGSLEVVTKRSNSGPPAKKRRTSSKKAALANTAAAAVPTFLQSPSPSSVVDPFFYGSSAMVASMDDHFFVESGAAGDGVSDAISEDLSEEEMDAMLALAAHDDDVHGEEGAHVGAGEGGGKLILPHRTKPQQPPSILGPTSLFPSADAPVTHNDKDDDDDDEDDAFGWLIEDELVHNGDDHGSAQATATQAHVSGGSMVSSSAGSTSTSTLSAPAPSPCLALDSNNANDNTSSPPHLTPSLSTTTVVGAPSLFSAQRASSSAPVMLPMGSGHAPSVKDGACGVSMPRARHNTTETTPSSTTTNVPVAPRPPSMGTLAQGALPSNATAAAFAKNAAAWMAMKHIVPAPQLSAARTLAYPTAPYLKVTHPGSSTLAGPPVSSTSSHLSGSASGQASSLAPPRVATTIATTSVPANESDTALDALSLAVFEDVMPFEDGDAFEPSLLVADPAL